MAASNLLLFLCRERDFAGDGRVKVGDCAYNLSTSENDFDPFFFKGGIPDKPLFVRHKCMIEPYESVL